MLVGTAKGDLVVSRRKGRLIRRCCCDEEFIKGEELRGADYRGLMGLVLVLLVVKSFQELKLGELGVWPIAIVLLISWVSKSSGRRRRRR